MMSAKVNPFSPALATNISGGLCLFVYWPQCACLGGRLIAYGPLNAFGAFTPVVTDRLGSVRARGTQQMSYRPYGEERTATANGQDKFGTYLRDAGGVDYADQRYYASNLGRFLTPDPSDIANTSDPSSWNRYAYVQGDPVNFYDPTGEFIVLPGGGVISLPITFIAWGIGKIFGIGGKADPITEAWKRNPGAQVAAWDRNIADEISKGEEQDRRYIKALKVINDCYQTHTLGGAPVRRFRYQPIDQHGQAFARGETVIREQNYTVRGSGQVVTGGVWGPGQQLPDGSFYDYLSKTSAFNSDIVMYQTFTAMMLNPEGFVPGVARAVMVYYPGYGSELFGTWGHWMTRDGVRTNNYFHHPAQGRKICDDPSFP